MSKKSPKKKKKNPKKYFNDMQDVVQICSVSASLLQSLGIVQFY